MSHQGYHHAQTQDPRLKRRASKSPDSTPTPREPKRAATLDRSRETSLSHNFPNGRSNGVVSTAAPVADMSRKSQNAPLVDLKMKINMQSVATTTLQIKYEHAEAQLKSAEADYHQHLQKNHFSAFPALKETKTAAVDRAKRAIKSAEPPLKTARLELQRLIESLVDLEQSSKAAPHDMVTRAEFDELKNDVNDIKKDISTIKMDLGSVRQTIDSCKASQASASKTLDDLQLTVDNHANRLESGPSNTQIPASADVLGRLQALESDAESREDHIYERLDAADEISKKRNEIITGFLEEQLSVIRATLVDIKKALQNTDNVVSELKTDLQRTRDQTIHLDEAITKGVEDQHGNANILQSCIDRLDKIEPAMGQRSEGSVREHHANAEVLQRCIDRLDKIEPILDQSANEGMNDRQANADTLQRCMDRLDRMEPLLEQAADKEALGIVKDSLQQLSDLVDAINASRHKAASASQQPTTNGVAPGLASFQPILGGDVEDDVSPFQSRPMVPGAVRSFDDRDIDFMKREIEGIKSNLQHQMGRYDNLVSDSLAQKMLDNLSRAYPHLKDSERLLSLVNDTVRDLHTRMNTVESGVAQVKTIADRVDLLDTKAVEAHRTTRQDLKMLRTDLAVLSGRVEQHGKAVATGEERFEQYTDIIKKAKVDLRNLEARVEVWITEVNGHIKKCEKST